MGKSASVVGGGILWIAGASLLSGCPSVDFALGDPQPGDAGVAVDGSVVFDAAPADAGPSVVCSVDVSDVRYEHHPLQIPLSESESLIGTQLVGQSVAAFVFDTDYYELTLRIYDFDGDAWQLGLSRYAGFPDGNVMDRVRASDGYLAYGDSDSMVTLFERDASSWSVLRVESDFEFTRTGLFLDGTTLLYSAPYGRFDDPDAFRMLAFDDASGARVRRPLSVSATLLPGGWLVEGGETLWFDGNDYVPDPNAEDTWSYTESSGAYARYGREVARADVAVDAAMYCTAGPSAPESGVVRIWDASKQLQVLTVPSPAAGAELGAETLRLHDGALYATTQPAEGAATAELHAFVRDADGVYSYADSIEVPTDAALQSNPRGVAYAGAGSGEVEVFLRVDPASGPSVQ